MELILFLICMCAAAAGSIAGFGGGIVIKPVLDALHLFPVATINFLSGCTVLVMSVVSLLKTRRSEVQLDMRIAPALGAGSAIGGVTGKALFDFFCHAFPDQNAVRVIQASCLSAVMLLVYVYLRERGRLRFHCLHHRFQIMLVGTSLGLLSSFLGIGGGPLNVAALFFFFSMEAKIAAKYSIYMILFAQGTSIAVVLASRTVPDFSLGYLTAMTLGGVFGAILGTRISRQMESRHVEKFLHVFTLIMLGISLYNVCRYALLIPIKQ